VNPYPSCALTHSAIDALLELRGRHGLGADQVAEIEVGVNRVVPDVLRHASPANGLERKFSMQFCAAAALATGRVDLGSFAEGPIADAGTRELMPRVRMVVDPTLPDGLNEHAWTRVTVRLGDGRALGSPPRGAAGHPDQPLTDAQLRDKFLACAAPLIGVDEAEGVATQLTHLEDIPDVRALTARLVTVRD
jgi:2-methylcitrate dehydratase PrpD